MSRRDLFGGADLLLSNGGMGPSDSPFMQGAIYDGGNLVIPCEKDNRTLCPFLAESWEPNADLTEWTFKIRDDVLWHDGVPFSAEDVKFQLDLALFGAEVGGEKRPPAPGWVSAWAGLQKVEVLSGNRVRFILGQPVAQWPSYLINTTNMVFAFPKHLMEPRIKAGEVNVTPEDIGMIGTGPFKFLDYDRGSRLRVVRFDGYWQKDDEGRSLPYLDGIDFAIITTPDAMDAAFRGKRLDFTGAGPGFHLSKERVAKYRETFGDDVQIITAPYHNGNFNMNLLTPGPLLDIRVRRAIALAINKQEASGPVLGGFGYDYCFMGPGNIYESSDCATTTLGFDGENIEARRVEAKRLLAEAGYPDGFTLRDTAWTVARSRCEFFQGQLQTVGINLELDWSDTPKWVGRRASLDYDTDCAMGAFAGTPLPEALLQRQYQRFSVSPIASPKHEDKKIDEFIARLSSTNDLDLRKKIALEAENYLLREMIYIIPVFGDAGTKAHRSYVKGYIAPTLTSVMNTNPARIWLDK